MTSYGTFVRKCYCCGKKSKHCELLSSNSWGSPDLDQRSPGMFRDTVADWLQECRFCGYVAPLIDKGDPKASSFVDTREFRAACLDPLADPASRRFLVRAAQDAYYGDRRSAFLNTLCAAWIADDNKEQSSEALTLRLRAAAHLEGRPIKSLDMRLLLLDVLRRSRRWEDAERLASELAAEGLDYPFADIVAFHRGKIEAKDSGRFTIARALGQDETEGEDW